MVISVASQKGGTGKTSTSISLAAGLARKCRGVLLIDIDSQEHGYS
jgi:chromosome partitioning protein